MQIFTNKPGYKFLTAWFLFMLMTPLKLNATEGPINHLTSQLCATCHKEIHEQWQGSMHAQSSALKDPIHAIFYKNVMGDPKAEGVKSKKGKFPVCLQCHAPNAAKDKKTKLDSNPAYAEGVNYVVCHTLKKFKGIKGPDGKLVLGIKAYEISERLQGPNGFTKERIEKLKQMLVEAKAKGKILDSPHLDGNLLVMDKSPIFKSSDVCMGCHFKRKNGKGVPLCATGDEYASSNAKVDCLSCHMPVNKGLADHSMGGGHDPAMLRRAAAMDIKIENQGENLDTQISIRNRQPHSLPTGAPFRNIYLTLTAYDANDNIVWSNSKSHPRDDDAQAYFMYELYDDNNTHTMPPKATKLGPDTRLKPFETRILNYSIPAADVSRIQAKLYYNLLWPDLVKKFTHLDPELTAPVKMTESEVNL